MSRWTSLTMTVVEVFLESCEVAECKRPLVRGVRPGCSFREGQASPSEAHTQQGSLNLSRFVAAQSDPVAPQLSVVVSPTAR
jgi:hypothetical protein